MRPTTTRPYSLSPTIAGEPYTPDAWKAMSQTERGKSQPRWVRKGGPHSVEARALGHEEMAEVWDLGTAVGQIRATKLAIVSVDGYPVASEGIAAMPFLLRKALGMQIVDDSALGPDPTGPAESA